MSRLIIYIGYDERQDLAYRACKESLLMHTKYPGLKILPLKQRTLRAQGLYNRRYYVDEAGVRYDSLDRRPFSTDFAFTRFLVPYLKDHKDYQKAEWYMFVDSDFIFRTDVIGILRNVSSLKPIHVVKHNYKQTGEDSVKMDGQVQSKYNKKLWSSLMLFNHDAWEQAERKYTLDDVNTEDGAYLHQFEAFNEEDMGSLDEAWNFIPDHSDEHFSVDEACAIHYTEGVPLMPKYRNCRHGDYFTDALYSALEQTVSGYGNDIYEELDN